MHLNGLVSARGLVTLGVLLSLLGGCSGSGGSTSGSPSTPPTATATAGTATLLPSVTTINATQADYVASSTATTWTLRTASSVQPGDVLLLQDAAVKVVSVDTSSGQMVLTVTLAQIEDVFSKLRLQQTFDQNSAEFIPDPASQIPATFTSTTAGSSAALSSAASTVNATSETSLKIPYNARPWKANLEFKLVGKVNLNYDRSANTGITGSLDVTGMVQGDAELGTEVPIAFDLPEFQLGTLKIPIPLSVVDSVLNAVGIRVASIRIPLSVGARAKVEVALGVGVTGSIQAQVITTYDATNGFSESGPTVSGNLGLKGLPSSSVPTAPLKATLMIGPYVHARPQLVILNQVGSIGADVKVGLYGKGTIQSMVSSPYYCINLNPEVQGEAFGFFKSVVLGTFESPRVMNELTVGLPFLFPDPRVFGGTTCNGVQFSASTYSVSQSDGSATITVTRTGDDSKVATVQYATSDGTAQAGLDYTATSGTLTFNPNDPSETFVIPIRSNLLSQGGTVNLTLSQPSSEVSLGTPNTATLTIVQGSQTFVVGPGPGIMRVLTTGACTYPSGVIAVDYTQSYSGDAGMLGFGGGSSFLKANGQWISYSITENPPPVYGVNGSIDTTTTTSSVSTGGVAVVTTTETSLNGLITNNIIDGTTDATIITKETLDLNSGALNATHSEDVKIKGANGGCSGGYVGTVTFSAVLNITPLVP